MFTPWLHERSTIGKTGVETTSYHQFYDSLGDRIFIDGPVRMSEEHAEALHKSINTLGEQQED